jgi:hypothetical protein
MLGVVAMQHFLLMHVRWTTAGAGEHESFKMRQLNLIYSELQSAGAL